MTWLNRVWMSPAEHERIVDELQTKIDRLEAEYVAVTRALVGEIQAGRNPEPPTDVLPAIEVDPVPVRSGQVIPFERRSSKKARVFVAPLEEHQV